METMVRKMVKGFLLFYLFTFLPLNMFAQGYGLPLIEPFLQHREKMLADFDKKGKFKNEKEFFSNENNLINAIAATLTEVKDESTKRMLFDFATSPLNNLLIGANKFVESKPAFACELMDTYFAALEAPMFAGSGLKANQDAYYVYATALQATKGDAQKMVACYQKALETTHGPVACQQLIALYKASGDKDGERQYRLYGHEHFPQYLHFGIGLTQQLINEQNYDEAIKYADILIKQVKDGKVDELNQELNWYPHYLKASALFDAKKYDQAYDAFVEGDAAFPGHYDLIVNAGIAAITYADKHSDNPAVSMPWYQKALNYLKQAEQSWPKQSSAWGRNLFTCYQALGDMKSATKYRKYVK